MATNKSSQTLHKLLAATRISLGFVFLWAFFDKLLGLGFSTCRDVTTNNVTTLCDSAWVSGGSPTTGFLKFGTNGPLADFYQSLAGNGFVDWLFMIGLLGIGLGLVLGIAMRLSTISGIVMMLLMYSAKLLPENNPLIDDHIIYALVLAAIYSANSQQVFGYAKEWASLDIVKKFPLLR